MPVARRGPENEPRWLLASSDALDASPPNKVTSPKKKALLAARVGPLDVAPSAGGVEPPLGIARKEREELTTHELGQRGCEALLGRGVERVQVLADDAVERAELGTAPLVRAAVPTPRAERCCSRARARAAARNGGTEYSG